MKKDEFSKNVAILSILGAIIFVIISSYLAIEAITTFKNVKEVLPIIISIFAIFATLGGSYLGASISGKNTIYAMEKEQYINKIENLKSVQNEILFNMEYVWIFLDKVYNNLGIDKKDVQKELKGRSLTMGTYKVIFDKLSQNNFGISSISIDRDVYMNLQLLKEIIVRNSREYRLFDELLSNNLINRNSTNKFFKMKQHIDIIDEFVLLDNDKANITINSISKQYLIGLFDCCEDVNDILKQNPKK
ncbi:hypothetical protein BUY68_03560 [Staphylococcus epidermidis]|uniref:hypothetical protein n=2 Tax=Staphylococcus epidermidis TaxID=1282 RepID=UPI000D1CD44F|nr:hypothetical protein [Staphylococcus epidermidis]PTE92241.1 hypothetical protein BUY68_03560 [Staphylococcus epidermidis]PTE95672.1 hypothetical protein BUY63_11060 [Staphylococcus epidermidis]